MRSNTGEVIKAIAACTLVFAVVVIVMVAKMEAYGGNPECMFIHCVKVIK